MPLSHCNAIRLIARFVPLISFFIWARLPCPAFALTSAQGLAEAAQGVLRASIPVPPAVVESAVAETLSRKSSANKSILMCKYEHAHEELPHPHHGLHKEPDRMFSVFGWQTFKHGKRDWKRTVGDFVDVAFSMAVGAWTALGLDEKRFMSPYPRVVHRQDVRVYSLQKTWAVVPLFFEEFFPDIHWWASSGSLIGAMRSGGTIPWDTDGDMAVDFNETFNTAETWATLLELAGGEEKATWVHSYECWKYGGACLMVPLPKKMNPSGDVVFLTHKLPTSDEFAGRFVDLETGYFVEIIDQGQFADSIYPLQQCVLDGTLVNVPARPGRLLEGTEQYSPSDFLYGDEGEESIAVYIDRYSCQMCDDHEMAANDTPGTRDNFKMSLVPAGSLDGQETWVEVDTAEVRNTQNCRPYVGPEKPQKLNLKTSCVKKTGTVPLSAFVGLPNER